MTLDLDELGKSLQNNDEPRSSWLVKKLYYMVRERDAEIAIYKKELLSQYESNHYERCYRDCGKPESCAKSSFEALMKGSE